MHQQTLQDNIRTRTTQLALVFGLLFVSTVIAVASTSGTGGMPWEGPLASLLDSLTGPVARIIGAFGIIALGIGIAFSEGGGMMKKVLWVVLGLTIMFNATSWGLSFVGYSGGLLV
jgi:type IV secretory pathway VirB2 component (pilin)